MRVKRIWIVAFSAVVALTLPASGVLASTDAKGRGGTITLSDAYSATAPLLASLPPSTTGTGVLTPEQMAYQFCTSGTAALRPSEMVALCAQFMTPAAPGTPAPPPPTAADVAATWSQSAVLPNPSLRIRPGYAVTGLAAYLEIGTPAPWTVSIADPVRNDAITISCGHTSFDVSWGDGTPVQQTSSTGGPYPNGNVKHVYQQAAPSYTVAVTEHWSCRWSDPAGNGGTLTGLRSAGRLPLEVREIQTTN